MPSFQLRVSISEFQKATSWASRALIWSLAAHTEETRQTESKTSLIWLKFIKMMSSRARWKQAEEMFTLLVSLLMCACVSLSREMELLLRPPTTAISVLKFCNSSSFCQRRRRRKHQARGQRSRQQRNVLDTAEGNFRDCEKRGGVKVKKYLQQNRLRWM